MQNISVDSDSAWNIPQCIFMPSVSISLFPVCRHKRVLQQLVTFLVNDITLLLIPINSRIWLFNRVAPWLKLSDNQSMPYTNTFSCVYILVVFVWNQQLIVASIWSAAAPFLLFWHHIFIFHIITIVTAVSYTGWVVSHHNSDCCQLCTVVWRAITIVIAVSCAQWCGESSQ